MTDASLDTARVRELVAAWRAVRIREEDKDTEYSGWVRMSEAGDDLDDAVSLLVEERDRLAQKLVIVTDQRNVAETEMERIRVLARPITAEMVMAALLTTRYDAGYGTAEQVAQALNAARGTG